jgi:hypothetical protein
MRGDSSRVRLEVAFLDADDGVSAPLTPAAPDARAWRTVLVVAAEPDVRRYVGECLRERRICVVEAATVSTAVALGVMLAGASVSTSRNATSSTR